MLLTSPAWALLVDFCCRLTAGSRAELGTKHRHVSSTSDSSLLHRQGTAWLGSNAATANITHSKTKSSKMRKQMKDAGEIPDFLLQLIDEAPSGTLHKQLYVHRQHRI